MKHTILLLALIISTVTCAQENTPPKRININVLAPHLPLVSNSNLSNDELTILASQLEGWREDYYDEFDAVRNHLISMYIDQTVELYTVIDGVELDPAPIYRLKNWEMDHGLSEEEWQPIWERIQMYRAEHSEE